MSHLDSYNASVLLRAKNVPPPVIVGRFALVLYLAGWAGYSEDELMEVSETISCPFCGQSFELAIDTSVESQRFVTDCEICCRPFTVSAECEAGEVLSLAVE